MHRRHGNLLIRTSAGLVSSAKPLFGRQRQAINLLTKGRTSVLTLAQSKSKTSENLNKHSFLASSAAALTFAASLLLLHNTTRNDWNTTTTTTCRLDDDSNTTLLNWSGTHAVNVANDRYWEPETIEEVEEIVKFCHHRGQAVRPLGSALSPNGIAFHSAGMISLVQLDKIISIDVENSTVTAQAGARVSDVIEALRPYNLTLPNLASIAEQQMGGLIQVGAHGTGSLIAPLDHFVTRMVLVTPGQGTLTLTRPSQPGAAELWDMAKVGLGCLGVVVEVTMECIPAHELLEHTFVLTRQEAKDQVNNLLVEHKHMRFMWIPYTDTVVCVTNDPAVADEFVANDYNDTSPPLTDAQKVQPLVDLLVEVTADTSTPFTTDNVVGMGFAEIRDSLLAVDPLDIDHVKRCNAAEAEFWKRSQGYVVKPSDKLLQFDCGGQQWVWEVCFPTGITNENNGQDMQFMEDLLKGIESSDMPAHSPIEQRWSASSSSHMSPAYGPSDGLHSWVGIINYLPSSDERQRRAITEHFTGPYCELMRRVGQTVNATSHWAKLERPSNLWDLVDLKEFLQKRFPLKKFNELRAVYDPKNILSSPRLDLLLGKPGSKDE